MGGVDLDGFDAVEERLTEMIEDLGGDSTDVVEFEVGTNVEYAVYVEFGTSKMEAQPYLLPAARKVAANPEQYITDPDDIEDLVRQIALAIERLAKKNAPVDTGNLMSSIRAERVD